MSFLERRQLLALLLYVRRRRRQKEFWVHPLISERYLTGSFYINHNKLRQDENAFFNYYRMSTATYDFLLYRLSTWIKRQDTKFRLCVPPNEMLAVTLRYLASGNTFTDMFYTYHLGIKTISEIISCVCRTIWDELSSEFLAPPNTDMWKLVASEFQARANFPNCLGAVDGKHIRIENFPSAGSMNYNYKGYYSIVLLAVADSNYKFVFVDIGAYGKDCDSAILQRTMFYKLLTEGRLQVPNATPLHPSLSNRMPFVLVGDEAFQLNNNMLRPYGGKHLDVKKRIFNYRLSRARRYVECAFGILANKWRILHRPLNVSKELSKDIVKACVVLHNIVRERDGYTHKDMFVRVNHNGLQDIPSATNNSQAGRTANDIRNNFADFFLSPAGSVPWQMSKI